MVNDKASLFHMYTLGYVVRDNHTSCNCSINVEIFPIEKLTAEFKQNMLYKLRAETNDGTTDTDIAQLFKDEKVKIKAKELIEKVDVTKDWKDSDEKEVKIDRSRTITATWAAMSAYNEYNPPCVHRGDIVIIYKYGDMHEFFWEVLWKRITDKDRTGEGSLKHYSSNGKQEVSVEACSNSISYRIGCRDFGADVWNYLALRDGDLYYSNDKKDLMALQREDGIYSLFVRKKMTFKTDNIYQTALKIYDIKTKKLSFDTKNIIMKSSSGTDIDAGGAFNLKAGAITLQGNVVIKGNMVIAGSVTPASCPCCCMCPTGGGGGGGSIASPDQGYKKANKKLEELSGNAHEEGDNFLENVISRVNNLIAAFAKIIGIGKK